MLQNYLIKNSKKTPYKKSIKLGKKFNLNYLHCMLTMVKDHLPNELFLQIFFFINLVLYNTLPVNQKHFKYK